MRTPPNTARIDRELLLKACFGEDEESRQAWEACAAVDGGEIDAAARRLLPLLHRRHGGLSPSSLTELAHRAYIATWRQNRERMAHVGEVLREFDRAGIECMLLKGAALTLRHYRDYGVRTMSDFDLLIHPGDLEPAIRSLLRDGWVAEGGCTIDAIRRQSRVRHAWQFARGDSQNCDLHWRPLARCYSPQVTGMFWQGAEIGALDGQPVKFPCPTDQFFHVCVHAMHWEWTTNLYWVADALTVLRGGEVDWDRAAALGAASNMRFHFSQALTALASRFQLAIPKRAMDAGPPSWERSEYALMQKPCPLGLLDSFFWHRRNFQRIRPFDPQWREKPAWMGFAPYLAAFLDAPTARTMLAGLWEQIKLRARGHAVPR